MNDLWLFALTTLVLTVVAVEMVRVLALRRGVMDVPNARSSHTRLTPRGGGVGVVAVAIGMWAILAAGTTELSMMALPLVGVVLVAIVGWADDRRGGVPPRLRLAVHGVGAALFLPLVFSAAPTAPSLLLLVWWAFFYVSAINVVNFIDGIDGIIGAQVLVLGLHIALLGGPTSSGYAAVLAGAAGGFLVHNWSPARIFLGDVGSGALGAAVVVLGYLAISDTRFGTVAVFLPVAPIFLDAAVTLIRRALRGERLSQAHREHVYQRLANGGWGHGPVAALYAAASVAAAALVHVRGRAGVAELAGYLLACSVVGIWATRSIRKATPD